MVSAGTSGQSRIQIRTMEAASLTRHSVEGRTHGWVKPLISLPSRQGQIHAHTHTQRKRTNVSRRVAGSVTMREGRGEYSIGQNDSTLVFSTQHAPVGTGLCVVCVFVFV